jgi:hypothetical protein
MATYSGYKRQVRRKKITVFYENMRLLLCQLPKYPPLANHTCIAIGWARGEDLAQSEFHFEFKYEFIHHTISYNIVILVKSFIPDQEQKTTRCAEIVLSGEEPYYHGPV